MTDARELQVKEKQEIALPAEQTKIGMVFHPNVDIFETDREIILLADIPGVAPEDVTIDLRDDILTIYGDVKPFEGPDETDILVEFEIGKYFRKFTLSEAIDQSSIEATFSDGVLRLRLPKAEKATPRKIVVKS
jgi:HSP20 family molecular chaperone IbpA